VNVQLEEQLLSAMMDGERVESLQEFHFTSAHRAHLYLGMRSGVPYCDLEGAMRSQGWAYEECAYITDVFLTPRVPRGNPMREAVTELKRLHIMRRFCRDVDAWRKAAPHMDWKKATYALGEVIRQQGVEAARDEFQQSPIRGQNGAAGPSPK